MDDYQTLRQAWRNAQRVVEGTVIGSQEFREAVRRRNAIVYALMRTPSED